MAVKAEEKLWGRLIISAESPAVISPTETLSVHTPAMTDLNPGEDLFDLFDRKKGSRLKGEYGHVFAS